MTDTSPHLSLPYIAPAQAQKHVTHNEALLRLDILTQLRVQAFDATIPPGAPIEGEVYATGLSPTGDWAGQGQSLAAFSHGVWVFIAPQDGWLAIDATTGAARVWQSDTWAPVIVEMNNLDGVGIGTTSDISNRLSVSSAATLFSHDGGDHQIKLNKASASDTGTMLFQSNWSGRAEIGLAGNDDFSVKVSADGSTWTNALRIDPVSGAVAIGPGATYDDTLSVASGGVEPTIRVRNTGGAGGASFRLIDDLSGGDWKFKTTADGSFKLRNHAAGWDHIFLQNSTRSTEFAGPVQIGSYTVATLPDPAVIGAASMIYVSDETGGGVTAFSDGTNWRRTTDRAVVS
ncbi:MAG: DUF2793 domain-containing protein [Sulfitobacter sp.]